MNRLDSKQRERVLSALVEGCSIRSTARMTGVSKPTILKLLVHAGAVASKYQDEVFRNLKCKRIQVDELWAFLACKAKNVTPKILAKNPAAGDIWLWVGIDAQSKLVPSWTLGDRSIQTARAFVSDLASRLANRVQLTSDGHKPYLEAVEGAFGAEIDYATLTKLYGSDPDGEKRYSPAKCIGCESKVVTGSPEGMPGSPLKLAAPVQPTLRRLFPFDKLRFRRCQSF